MNWVRLSAGARHHGVFGVALAAAVVVRVLVLLAFQPIMWFGGDSASYLATGLHLVPDASRVGGYALLWWLLRPLHSVAAVAVVQHVMGLAVGVLGYRLARRHGLPGWAATLVAVPVLFDAYQLQLESDAVPDVPFGLLVFIALYLLLRAPGERRPAVIGAAAFVLGVTAILWPVGLGLLVVLVVALVIRRAGVLAVAAAILAGAVPVAGYAAWFDLHEHQFGLTRSEGVYLWSRTMSFADCAVIKPPADERTLCPPAGTRIAASLYIWDGDSPLLRLPGGRFSARTNSLTRNFALRAIAAQPGGYLTAVGHDIGLSFSWDRPVHPDAGIVDRYKFADAATAWVPARMAAIGGGTVAGDQAAYNGGHPAATRAVQPFAGWLVGYQRFVYLRGTLVGVILLGGAAAMIIRWGRGRRGRDGRRDQGGRRDRGGSGLGWAFGLAWGFAAAILVVPPMIADFDLRYLVPAVPAACLAAALAFAPRPGQDGPGGPAGQRRCTTSPAATGTSEPGDTRTTSLPSGSTPTASPDTS